MLLPCSHVDHRSGARRGLRGEPLLVLFEVLLDEFEKAHPDVQAVFMQLLDEGMVPDPTAERRSAASAVATPAPLPRPERQGS